MEYFLQKPVQGLITDYPEEVHYLQRKLKRENTLYDQFFVLFILYCKIVKKKT